MVYCCLQLILMKSCTGKAWRWTALLGNGNMDGKELLFFSWLSIGLFILGFCEKSVMKSCDHHTFGFLYWAQDGVKLGWLCVIFILIPAFPHHTSHAVPRWRSCHFTPIPSRLCHASVTTSQGSTEVGSFRLPVLGRNVYIEGEMLQRRKYHGMKW